MELVVDTWEGQGNLDEGALKANGVRGIISRLNDMNGGHHLDAYFAQQWEQSAGFLRAPYFVYNPWVDGYANYNWLAANVPSTPIVFIDVEVSYANITPEKYAADLADFIARCNAHWLTRIYTGGWFLPKLAYWPTHCDYWFARYPTQVYPDAVQAWTWEQFRQAILPLDFNLWMYADPKIGQKRLWQVTGDRLILPGSTKPLDVSLWPGTSVDLASWFGVTSSDTPPQSEPSWQQSIDAWARTMNPPYTGPKP